MTTLNWTKPTNYDDVDDDFAGDNFVENNEDNLQPNLFFGEGGSET